MKTLNLSLFAIEISVQTLGENGHQNSEKRAPYRVKCLQKHCWLFGSSPETPIARASAENDTYIPLLWVPLLVPAPAI